ncbi:MAG: DUF3078 domain-containing protein [Candidatus Eiseniibacteriota bacterium]
MQRAILVGLAFLCAAPRLAGAQGDAPAEPGPWKYEATLGLNLSQSAFSDNWAGGDQGSITWVLKSDLGAERQLTRKFHWANDLQLAYGQTAQQNTDAASGKKSWSAPDKTTDLIQLESLGRFTLNRWVDPYVGFRLESQFIDESSPVGQILFNPVRLKETGGVARVFQKTETSELISRAGFGFRQNIARTFTDATGDETESFSTNDGGFEWQTDAKAPLAGGKIQYKGQLLVFVPVFYSQSGDLEDFDAIALGADPGREEVADFWRIPDVNFQNTFDAKITEWLSVNLYLQWIYDKFDAATNVDTSVAAPQLIAEVDGGIRKGGQFKQTLALALSYRFL